MCLILFIGLRSKKTNGLITMDRIRKMLIQVEKLHKELVSLEKDWNKLHDCTSHAKEIDELKKEIRCLNHMLEEQDCEIRHLGRNSK